MPEYKAPVRDMKFLAEDVLDMQAHYQTLPNGGEATPDLVDAIISEGAKFAENVLAPLNRSGDEEGCHWQDGEVITPKGFKAAYQQYVAGGWQSLSHPPEYGGQGLPMSLGVMISEMVGTANWSWGMYPGLTLGAMNTLFLHGTEAQRQTWLTRMTSGEWSGTMCLTEPQCGTDLGQVKTRAIPNGDDTYRLSGTKIFISAGDHDLTENIVHIVLARLPDAPEGTRGISLFIVSKFKVNPDGSLRERNGVTCGSLEHKMGIKASATCVMNFDEAEGYLIGPENKGLQCMFTFMNTARIGTGIQGLASAELAYQGALPYARERLSMRSLSGTKQPDKVADSLIVHPDVRRMLLTMKAFAEGGRAMLYDAAKLADRMITAETEAERNRLDEELGMLTPILKGFLTEAGLEAANLGVQVFGGHGYIREHGMEQIIRDARISTLYEGTTGIQSLDLLGRKVLLSKGKDLNRLAGQILNYCKTVLTDTSVPRLKLMPFVGKVTALTLRWQYLSYRLAFRAARNRDVVGSASVDYLMFSGYVVMAYYWLKMLVAAQRKLAEGTSEPAFYKAKVQTAEFYFSRILPRAETHAKTMLACPRTLTRMKEESFAFL